MPRGAVLSKPPPCAEPEAAATASSQLPFTVERNHPNVVTVRMDGISAGWECWYLLRSDAHHDNLHCDRELEKRHLEQAKARQAGILDYGDLSCLMQGRWDPRADQEQLRPELRGNDYLDRVLSEAEKHYGPYAANWVLLAPGNHEVAVKKRHGTDMTERLAERLRAQPGGSPVEVGTYQGWVRFQFTWHSTKRMSVNLRYTHGYGGGGPVTKDVIQANRQLVYLDNADIIVSGHSHDAWHIPHEREGLDHHGRPERRTVDAIKCGGYKDEYSPGQGWAVEKGHPPKPLGSWWLRFFYVNQGSGGIGREFRRTDSPMRRGD